VTCVGSKTGLVNSLLLTIALCDDRDMAQRLVRRLALASGFALAVAVAPAVGFITSSGSQPPQILGNCPNGPSIPVGLQGLGAFQDNCSLVITVPPAIGAAPSAGAIIACRGLPGCLSSWVNNPGLVRVPAVDVRVQNSP
jgi:hypothetical protein